MPAFVEALGASNVSPAKPVMGAEDFGLFGEGNVPICMFWLGTISPERLAAATAKGETPAGARTRRSITRNPAPASPPAFGP